jgi:hypothetical protein
MRTSVRALSIVLLAATAAVPTSARQAARVGAKAAPRAAAAAPAPIAPPPPVAIAQVFTVTTGQEKWTLDDPIPGQTILFAGRPMTLEERQVNASTSRTGETQMVFPISWHAAYASARSEVKLVVVRFDAKVARSIVAEYEPDRVSMPRADFTYDEAGKQYYRTLSYETQNGKSYVKQALSSGRTDAAGNLWVDRLVLYSVDTPPAAARK